jgi:fermentation-respiration switch protein FrsA (DUF1100 family)
MQRLKWPYIFKLTGFAVIVILLALLFLLVEVNRQIIKHFTMWDCPQPVRTPADVGLTDYKTLPVEVYPGQTLTGWYIPSQNGAAVLELQGHWSARDDRLPEAALLAQHGYCVMLLDPHPCLGPGVPHTMGHAEVDDVAAAIEVLRRQPEVADGRIGVHGFSIGGVIAVESAARNPQIQAVIAEGNFHDLTTNITPRGVRGNAVGELVRFFLIFFYQHYTGLHPDLVKPIESVTRISPRPLFLIAGEYEAAENRTQAQFEAAGRPKQLWIVPDVDHGGYSLRWPEMYETNIITFFNEYLLDSP